jgi:hypothetical protein
MMYNVSAETFSGYKQDWLRPNMHIVLAPFPVSRPLHTLLDP